MNGPPDDSRTGSPNGLPNGSPTADPDARETLDKRTLLDALTAFGKGDFSVRLPEGLDGLDGRIAHAFNDVIGKTEDFTEDLERLSGSIEQAGELSARLSANGFRGNWASMVSSVNQVVGDLTQPIRETSRVIGAVARGDLTQTMELDIDGRPLKGEFLVTAKTVNSMVARLDSFAAEVTRVSREVGTDGALGGQARVAGVSGTWKDLTDSVNSMASNLTDQLRNIAEVTTAVANGDLSKKITVDVRGEMFELKNTVNTMVDQLNSFASEVTRVAREVGTEGKLGGQANVKGVAGTWKDLTENVNSMASNLTDQVRNIATVTTAVAKGDLSKKITVDAQGEILELKDTVNTMVDQLSSFADEVTRVAREVGTEGQLGGQADVKGVAGTWKDLTDNVNLMASNLTVQLRDVSKVATAIAEGDLTQKITVEVSGEILQIKNVINIMVDQLSSFADEVTRVAREVGTEGQLGGQANVKGVAGTWKDLTDSVNSMAGNLTDQVRNIAAVVSAMANGDLSNKITVHVRGEMLELKQNVNNLLDQLNSFASEVTRVAREVGTEGKLGGQASVPGVAGTWKDLTDNVNSMASNLTAQVRNIAAVTTAVANGDLSKKITVDAQGEILELKSTVNTMVDQLSSFADEVTRVAREVGTEGKLGGQANVKGVAGTWRDLTESVNSMAGNLTDQVRNVAAVTTAVANGDLSKKITVDVRGEMFEMKDTINTMVDQLRSFAAEVTRVAREVGTEGKLGGQASVPGVAGTWKDLTDNVNSMARNLTGQVRNIAAVTTAVANGDLSKHITVDVHGEMLEMKDTLNTMVDQLNRFASEVTRVAREVGSEGKLGGQADVKGVAGTWKDLTDNVNSMAGNLTNQVRGIARVVTAVANGNLTRKLAVDAQGEIAELADTINGMIDTLAIFADQITSVAREVGVEGKLGGQASVPGAAGIWKDLTDNVNQLADNLTTQVRAIADVATAVTRGDLTRSIQADAQGEVAALKDNINEMIRNLKDTTSENADQDWLKTNLAKFSRMLQGQKDLETVGTLILRELATVVEAQQGAFFVMREEDERHELRFLAGYACDPADRKFQLGDGLIGECARENRKIELTDVPRDYLQVRSALGDAAAANVVILPITMEDQVKAVMELASLKRFSEIHHTFLDQLCESIGIVLNTIEANTRTEGLLKQSQSLASELQSQQQELQQTNAELEDKARLLEDRNVEVERKNWEVEQARRALEEKAEQLALTSKYKSEFLANMSHELRTPLNTLLILSDELRRNPTGNLSEQQVKCAHAILASANDLLNSINDILDLSKIESGTVVIEVVDVSVADIREYVERTFRHMAEAQHLDFQIDADADLPDQIRTDVKRLQQVLKNLLSNAFKFTERGSVSLSVRRAMSGWSRDNQTLCQADEVLAFDVQDTGIGIPSGKQQVIFEAFQQADGSTSRRYGGTGLGLAISREIAELLGGEIKLSSEPGKGSTFTLYLPQPCAPASAATAPLEMTEAVLDDRSSVETASAGADASITAIVGAEVAADPQRERAPTLLLVGAAFQPVRSVAEVVRRAGWGVISRSMGSTAMSALRERAPSAIALDVNIVDIDGWNFLAALKQDIELRHLPVLVAGAGDELPRALRLGAVGGFPALSERGVLTRTLSELESWQSDGARRLYVIGAGERVNDVLTRLGVNNWVTRFEDAEALLAAVDDQPPHVLVVGENITAPAAARLKEWLGGRSDPVTFTILLTGCQEGSNGSAGDWEPFMETTPLSLIRESELLLDRLSLVLHIPVSHLPETEQRVLRRLSDPSGVLAMRRALIVDDDIRNIFAMTSVLERYGMDVLTAETGRDAIELLEAHDAVDIVLMDIMMPEMDGYETIRAIRTRSRFRSLPIVAVTAKAMVGDRQKCREAGASDYIPKPVDTDQLVRVMAGWLRQRAV